MLLEILVDRHLAGLPDAVYGLNIDSAPAFFDSRDDAGFADFGDFGVVGDVSEGGCVVCR